MNGKKVFGNREPKQLVRSAYKFKWEEQEMLLEA